jgi:NADP-dependent 3-hydroxy acid dehydrogenase YdfG
MKILVIGAEGAVGSAAISDLSKRHEILKANRSSKTLPVDVMDEASVEALFVASGKVDAVIVTTGHTHFGVLTEMTPTLFRKGLDDKLMGQINVALVAMRHLTDGGSITLTSGVTNRDYIRKGANAAAVNGALDAFVQAAALEMPRGLRINSVSPALLDVSAQKYDGFFPGHVPVSSVRVGFAFTKAVEGFLNGQVIIADA